MRCWPPPSRAHATMTIVPTPCETPAPMDWNLATAFESVCDALPDRVALIQGDRRVHVAIVRRARARGSPPRFTAAGLKPDSKVASYLYNCNEYTEALYGTFKMRGVPVNVNYRYLEDELVYLLDNSDAEALLFHGSLGDHVAKVRDRAPEGEALGPGRRRLAAPGVRGRSTRSSSRARRRWNASSAAATTSTSSTPAAPRACRRASCGAPKTCSACSATACTRSSGQTRPETMAEVGPIAKALVDAGANRVHLPASPLMHGTGAFTTFQALFLGAVDRHARRPALRPARAVGDGAARAGHADGDRRRRVRQADAARARGGRGEGRALRHLVAAAHHQLGRDVVGRGEARAHGARQLHLPRLARIERRRRVRRLDQRARRRAEDGEVLDRRQQPRSSTTEGVEVVPGSGEVGRLAVGGYIPRRLLQGRGQVGRDVPRHRRRSAGRCPATSRASRPTARSRCSAAARWSSTPAARRSSPKRWKRR